MAVVVDANAGIILPAFNLTVILYFLNIKFKIILLFTNPKDLMNNLMNVNLQKNKYSQYENLHHYPFQKFQELPLL